MHKSSTNAPDEARRCLDLPSKDGGDRIYFNGSNIAVEDAGAQYGTNGSENSPETAGSAADRQQKNTNALLRLAESIENAVGCGIMVVKEPVFGEGHRIIDNVGGSGGAFLEDVLVAVLLKAELAVNTKVQMLKIVLIWNI